MPVETTSCSSVHPLKDPRVGCFHILAVVKDAAVSVGVASVFETVLSYFAGVSPETGLLDHIVIL